jgi:intracellular sulfur oxidation DsrE/DsrF family protein
MLFMAGRPKKPEPIKEKISRTFRPLSDRVADVEKKIVFHQEAVKRFEEKKIRMLANKTSEKAKVNTLLETLKEKGMTMDDLLNSLKTKAEAE